MTLAEGDTVYRINVAIQPKNDYEKRAVITAFGRDPELWCVMATKVQMSWKGDQAPDGQGSKDGYSRKACYHRRIHVSQRSCGCSCKINAPWTDRTGNARAGLHSGVVSDLIKNIGNCIWLIQFSTVFILKLAGRGNIKLLLPLFFLLANDN